MMPPPARRNLRAVGAAVGVASMERVPRPLSLLRGPTDPKGRKECRAEVGVGVSAVEGWAGPAVPEAYRTAAESAEVQAMTERTPQSPD